MLSRLSAAIPMLEVGYLGSRGLHLNDAGNLNRFYPGTALRPYPAYGTITYYTNGNLSAYDGLHVTFRHRFRKGLTANVNYSWSHSLDNTMAQFGSGPQDDANQCWITAAAIPTCATNCSLTTRTKFPRHRYCRSGSVRAGK